MGAHSPAFTACRRPVALFRRFRRDRDGATAVIFAIALLPTLIAVGAAVDYARLAHVQTAAQSATDSAALAAAISPIETEVDMRQVAARYLDANTRGTLAEGTALAEFSYDRDRREIQLRTSGRIGTSIMGLVGIHTMEFAASARAVRSMNNSTEVALVLDNTWSMNGSRLQSLKQAAEELVTLLKENPRADVRIGLVPYADYVNVGTQYRNAPWLAVPDDYATTSTRTCTTKTTVNVCTRGEPRTCTRTVDGVVETYDCTPNICTEQTVPPYESCTGGTITWYRWFGCVGSRTQGTLRTNDSQPSSPYPGLLATSQNCLNPIVPLTSSTATVVNAIRGMVVNVGGYRPSTYIPAGLIWGVNLLSPTAPFSEGAAYDRNNRQPRKVMVLMSDGEITLRFNAADGRHVAPSGNAATQSSQIGQSYQDMDAICTYAKGQGIEVFTVAFEVTDATAQKAMRACASSPQHYFDARDGAALSAAFRNIALSLNPVRITQ